MAEVNAMEAVDIKPFVYVKTEEDLLHLEHTVPLIQHLKRCTRNSRFKSIGFVRHYVNY